MNGGGINDGALEPRQISFGACKARDASKACIDASKACDASRSCGAHVARAAGTDGVVNVGANGGE